MKQADILSAGFELVKYGSDSQHAPSGSAVKYRASARAIRRTSSSSMDSIACERHPGSKDVHMSGMGDLAAQGCPSRVSASACACAHSSSVWLSRPQSPGTPPACACAHSGSSSVSWAKCGKSPPACTCTRGGSPLARSVPYATRSSAAIPPPFRCVNGNSASTRGSRNWPIFTPNGTTQTPSATSP